MAWFSLYSDSSRMRAHTYTNSHQQTDTHKYILACVRHKQKKRQESPMKSTIVDFYRSFFQSYGI